MHNTQARGIIDMDTTKDHLTQVLEELKQLHSNLFSEIQMKRSEIENLKSLYEELQVDSVKIEKIYKAEMRKKLTTTVNDLRKIGDSANIINSYIDLDDRESVTIALNNIMLLVMTISERFVDWNLLNYEDKLIFNVKNEIPVKVKRQGTKKKKHVQCESTENIETHQLDFELVEKK